MRTSVSPPPPLRHDAGVSPAGFTVHVVHPSRPEPSPETAAAGEHRLWPLYALAYGGLFLAALAASTLRPAVIIAAPAPLLLVLALSGSLALALGGQAYVHDRFAGHDFVQHNEVGGFIIAIAATLYAALLGFLTAVSWQEFAGARELVAQEAAAATNVWHAAVGLPGGVRTRVRADIGDYASVMAGKEWSLMRCGKFDKHADFIVMDAMTVAGTFVPANPMESNAQAATMRELSILHDVRQRRLAANEGGLAGFDWLVLLIGATCVITFCWLFGVANQTVHLLMTASVTILAASVLVLLFELQYPFRTDLGIAPESWNAAVDHIKMMQTGTQMEMRM